MRIIPSLSLRDGELVKTTAFRGGVYIGDPINAVRTLNDKMVDEIFISDLSRNKGDVDLKILEKIASQAYVPLSYCGKVTSREHVYQLIQMGYDKIFFRSIFLKDPSKINEFSQEFGSSTLGVVIDYSKKILRPKNVISEKKLDFYLGRVNSLECSEVILQNVDRDGTAIGLDYENFKKYRNLVKCKSIILAGGCSGPKDAEIASELEIDGIAVGRTIVFAAGTKAVLINNPYPSECA